MQSWIKVLEREGGRGTGTRFWEQALCCKVNEEKHSHDSPQPHRAVVQDDGREPLRVWNAQGGVAVGRERSGARGEEGRGGETASCETSRTCRDVELYKLVTLREHRATTTALAACNSLMTAAMATTCEQLHVRGRTHGLMNYATKRSKGQSHAFVRVGGGQRVKVGILGLRSG